VTSGFERRDEKKIAWAFNRHATFHPSSQRDCFGRFRCVRPSDAQAWFVSKERLRDALLSLDVEVKAEKIDSLFSTIDLDGNAGLDLSEFKRAIQASGTSHGARAADCFWFTTLIRTNH
jgi:hypothetical protein